MWHAGRAAPTGTLTEAFADLTWPLANHSACCSDFSTDNASRSWKSDSDLATCPIPDREDCSRGKPTDIANSRMECMRLDEDAFANAAGTSPSPITRSASIESRSIISAPSLDPATSGQGRRQGAPNFKMGSHRPRKYDHGVWAIADQQGNEGAKARVSRTTLQVSPCKSLVLSSALCSALSFSTSPFASWPPCLLARISNQIPITSSHPWRQPVTR